MRKTELTEGMRLRRRLFLIIFGFVALFSATILLVNVFDGNPAMQSLVLLMTLIPSAVMGGALGSLVADFEEYRVRRQVEAVQAETEDAEGASSIR